MIDIYTTSTAYSQRPMIMLEEIGLPYRKHFVDREKKAQRRPEFLAINPLGALPVLIDHNAAGGAAQDRGDRALKAGPGQSVGVNPEVLMTFSQALRSAS